MYIDKELMFSDAQALTAPAPSTDVIDLGESRDIGTGKELYHSTHVKADVTGTLVATLEASDDEAFGTGVEAVHVHTFDANAVAGSKIVTRLPVNMPKLRYLRVSYAGATAGEVDSFINDTVEAGALYKSGYSFN